PDERGGYRYVRPTATASHLDSTRPTIAPRSHHRYSEIVVNYLIPAVGSLPLTRLTAAHVQQAYNSWDAGGRRDGPPGGLSAIAGRYNHTVLRRALEHAVELQLIGRNPCDAFRRRLPKNERAEIVVLSEAQSNQLLGAAGALYMPILLAVATGM